MALTTRQRNNIILFTCIFFILILNITDRIIRDSKNYLPLFDEEYQLERVEFLGLVWQSNQLSWQCNFTHIECVSNGMFWQELKALPVDQPQEALHSNHVIRFTLKNLRQFLFGIGTQKKLCYNLILNIGTSCLCLLKKS